MEPFGKSHHSEAAMLSIKPPEAKSWRLKVSVNMVPSSKGRDANSLRVSPGVKDRIKVRGSVVAVRNHMGNVKLVPPKMALQQDMTGNKLTSGDVTIQ